MDSSTKSLGDVTGPDFSFFNGCSNSFPFVLPPSGLLNSKTQSFSCSSDDCSQQHARSSKSKRSIKADTFSNAGNKASCQSAPQNKDFTNTSMNTETTECTRCKYCSIRMSMLRQLEKRQSAKSSRKRKLSSEISASHVSGDSSSSEKFDKSCQTSSALFKEAPMTKKENRCFMVVLRYQNGKPLRTETFCSCALKGLEDDCTCGENNSNIEWSWDQIKRGDSTLVEQDPRTVMFHKDYSCGTAAICGEQLMDKDQYFWEIKMATPVYGTDMMIGVGTAGVDLNSHHNEFCSMLGIDGDSWGFSYDGRVQHNGQKKNYCGRYGQGAIVGVHLDMWHGTLTFYKNRRHLGIAYEGLRGKSLYPMACSTAARSAMRIVSAVSFPSSLQFLCARLLRKHVPDHLNVLEVLQMPPGLRRILSKTLGWLLRALHPKTPEKASKTSSSSSCICDICSPLKNVFEGYSDDEGENDDVDYTHSGFSYLDSEDEEDSEESDVEDALTVRSVHFKEQNGLVEVFHHGLPSTVNLSLHHPSTSSSGSSSPKRRRLEAGVPLSSKETNIESEDEDNGNSESEESILEHESSEENTSRSRKYKLGKRKMTQR